jgi:hypothetical protein
MMLETVANISSASLNAAPGDKKSSLPIKSDQLSQNQTFFQTL